MLKSKESKLTVVLTDDDLRELVCKAISDDLGRHIDKDKIVFHINNIVLEKHVDGGSTRIGLYTCTATYEEIT